MIDRQYLAELEGFDPGTSSTVLWRFSTQGYDAGGEDNFYLPAIENVGNFSRAIQGVEGGRVSLSYGEMTLTNIDGSLDAMADQYFDGRTLRVFVVRNNAAKDAAVEILNAQVESIAIERERVSVRLRDRAVTLEKPFSSLKYLGDNDLPLGFEGTTDIKDQAKPIVYGRVALMEPVLVNTSKLIYQVSAKPCTIINVFDAGAYLKRDDDPYVGYPEDEGPHDIETDEPLPGTYRMWPKAGMFRLGSSPFGTISVCVADSFNPQRISAAGLLKRILRDAYANRSVDAADTTIPADGWDWHWKDLQKLDEQNAGSLGLVVQPEETTASLIDRICKSVGAYWGFDAFGKLRIIRIDPPAGTPVAIINDENWIILEKLPDEQLPFNSVTCKADINYAVQEKSGLAGVVTDDKVNWFKLESRDQKHVNGTIKNQRLLSEESTFDTLLNSTTIAAAEAKRRVDLFATRRDWLSIQVQNPLSYINVIDLGSIIKVQTSRFGYDAGKLFVVTGISFDFAANTFDITCFG